MSPDDRQAALRGLPIVSVSFFLFLQGFDMSVHLRLKPNWPGTFRRTIKRDEKGKSLEVRVFTPGEVIEIPEAELPFLAEDIGKSLQPMEWQEEFGKYRPVDLSEIDLPEMIKRIKAGGQATEAGTKAKPGKSKGSTDGQQGTL